MSYLIYLGWCVLEKKITYSVENFLSYTILFSTKLRIRLIKHMGLIIRTIPFYRILSNVWAVSKVRMWYIKLSLTFKNTFELWEQEKFNVWKYVQILSILWIGDNYMQEDYSNYSAPEYTVNLNTTIFWVNI